MWRGRENEEGGAGEAQKEEEEKRRMTTVTVKGLPWWSSVWDLVFQYRECRFDPWSGS